MKFLQRLFGALILAFGVVMVVYGAYIWGFFEILDGWLQGAYNYLVALLQAPEVVPHLEVGLAIVVILVGLFLMYLGDKLNRS